METILIENINKTVNYTEHWKMQNGIQYFNCDFLNKSKDLIFLGGKMYQKSAEIRHLNGLTRGNPFGQQLEMKYKKQNTAEY